jgi:hypothetical protein
VLWGSPLNRWTLPGRGPPYDTSAVKNILKVEKINFDRNGKQHQLYGFAISAKRYDLYLRRPNGTVQILKPSEHGLGHLYFPDTRKRYIPKDCLSTMDRGGVGISA